MNRAWKNANPLRAKMTAGLAALAGAAVLNSFAAPNQVTPVPDADQYRSVFIDRPDFGKDPFYPRSERRGKVVVTNAVVEPSINIGNLALRGISGSKEKPLAIINTRTFEVGEEAEVRVSGGVAVKVKCLEIRERSVLVNVNGVTKELFIKL